jgi:uncharacterized membrane protein YfcA
MQHNYIIILSISLLASIIGVICGIGGGIIVKPILDSLGIMSVDTVNFLSGCMVMSMSGYSLISSFVKKTLKVELRTGVLISIGAVAGGILGKKLLELLMLAVSDSYLVGAVQAFLLFWLTFLILIYALNKPKVVTYRITNAFVCALAGLCLGLLSSFLGIGGGPFNLLLLSFLFSMQPKDAAQNSIFIIFFAQISNLGVTIAGQRVPVFSMGILTGMVIVSIIGAMIGRRVNKAISEHTVNKLFCGLNILIMLICIYNFCKII